MRLERLSDFGFPFVRQISFVMSANKHLSPPDISPHCSSHFDLSIAQIRYSAIVERSRIITLPVRRSQRSFLQLPTKEHYSSFVRRSVTSGKSEHAAIFVALNDKPGEPVSEGSLNRSDFFCLYWRRGLWWRRWFRLKLRGSRQASRVRSLHSGPDLCTTCKAKALPQRQYGLRSR